MFIERIDLYKYFGVKRPKNAQGFLNVFVRNQSKEYCPNRLRPAMIVIPGGGYTWRSDRENEPISLTYLNAGFNVFSLEYSVSPVKYPSQLLEGAMAVAYIKENAKKYNVLKDKVCAVGFSAGGHLAGMLATITDEKIVKETLKRTPSQVKPNAVILSYPVISCGVNAHQGSFNALCGEDLSLKEKLSLEKRVNKKTVPAFIWSTFEDSTVSCENSLLMAKAYKENGIPFELHIFANGQHGLSLANEEVNTVNVPVSEWVKLSLAWLREREFIFKDKNKKN